MLRVGSWNDQGLCEPEKMKILLRECKRHDINVITGKGTNSAVFSFTLHNITPLITLASQCKFYSGGQIITQLERDTLSVKKKSAESD